MASERYEIRLDKEHRARLGELAATYGVPGSTVVKELIDKAYEEKARERRLAAARRIAELEVEDVPDMKTLRKQLNSTYDVRLP
jgi:hypothetical protein